MTYFRRLGINLANRCDRRSRTAYNGSMPSKTSAPAVSLDMPYIRRRPVLEVASRPFKLVSDSSRRATSPRRSAS